MTADTLLALLIALYCGMILVSPEIRGRFFTGVRDFVRDYLSLFLTALFLVMVLSVSYATDKKLAVTESARFLSYLLMYFIIKYELNQTDVLKGMLRTFLLISTLLGIFGIIQYYTGLYLDERFYIDFGFGAIPRIAASLDNPNAFAAYLILIIFPVLMLAIHHRNRLRGIFYGALSLLLITNLALTFSRNALLAFAIGCAILILIYSWKLLFVFAPMMIISLFIPQILHRVRDLTNFSENVSRLKLWKVALKMIHDHPLIGVGNGNFVTLYDTYITQNPELRHEDWTHYPTHNSYLKVQSELGILGTVTFLGSLVAAVIKVKELLSLTQDHWFKAFYTGFLASMIAFYFMNLSDNLFFVPKVTSYFWLGLAIGDALLYRYKHNLYNESSSPSFYTMTKD